MATYAAALAGGTDAVDPHGAWWRLTVGGTWAAGDRWTLSLTDLTGEKTIGAGRLTEAIDDVRARPGTEPVRSLAFKGRLYFTTADLLYFSAQDNALEWEVQGPSAGFIQLSNSAGAAEDLNALAPYQGKLAVLSRRTVQIWEVDPDPINFDQVQVLDNIGTVSGKTVCAVGEMDVYFLADSGFRSLRVRDASNNAMVVDVGSPIDDTVQTVLRTMSEASKQNACGVMEPEANRYWGFLKDKIYVLSYFPTAGIAAWSTYLATYQDLATGAQVAFTPVKLVNLNGRVFALSSDGKIYLYGGANNATYDNCVCTWQTPWLTAGKPGTRKIGKGLHAAAEGTWALSVGFDPVSGTLNQVYANNRSSFPLGVIPVQGAGSHFGLKGVSSGSGYARVSHCLLSFQEGEEL